jgi:hypothetical protein
LVLLWVSLLLVLVVVLLVLLVFWSLRWMQAWKQRGDVGGQRHQESGHFVIGRKYGVRSVLSADPPLATVL